MRLTRSGAALGVIAAALASPLIASAETAPDPMAALYGVYEVIAARSASATAAPLGAGSLVDDPRGQVIEIAPDGVRLPGDDCAPATLSIQDEADVMESDPMLSDLRLPDLDRVAPPPGIVVIAACEGGGRVDVYQADPRAVAIPWNNGAGYLVAEKPLTPDQIERLQTELKSMKFFTGEPSSAWSERALDGLRGYYGYRVDKDAYRFERPAITASLLEKLGVLDE